jgi:hypothetical protein
VAEVQHQTFSRGWNIMRLRKSFAMLFIMFALHCTSFYDRWKRLCVCGV